MQSVALFFEEFGVATAPPLLIVHGFFASSRNWRQIAKQLGEHYHVYVLDMRNHGASPQHAEMDYPSMAFDILQFMRQHGIARAHLLGHSMGGKVVMWFALLYPDRVEQLVVVDISPLTYQHSFTPLLDALQQLPLAQLSNRKQADDLLSVSIADAGFRQFLLQNLVLQDGQYRWRINLDFFRQAAPAIVAFPEADALKPYAKQIAVFAGANSSYVQAESFIPLFPLAQISVIANAGHWLHVEQTADFLQQLQQYLAHASIQAL